MIWPISLGRDYDTLEDMQKGAVSVEANMVEKRYRMRAEKKVTYRDDTIASSSNSKYDSLAKNMERIERMMEKMVVQVNN